MHRKVGGTSRRLVAFQLVLWNSDQVFTCLVVTFYFQMADNRVSIIKIIYHNKHSVLYWLWLAVTSPEI